jgi:pyruvate-formate lyase-activating enzyme
MAEHLDRIHEMKQRLKTVSPSFCLAKWLQVTVHLHNGQTHSCHHPGTHAIPLEELKRDVSALHNTSFKKEQRKQMLEGKRPDECQYCWNIEDSAPDLYSDRHIKSHDPWAEPHFDRIRTQPSDQNVNPTYVEVSFSTTCNFKCSYCSPAVSSKWMEEIRQHGAYPTSRYFNGIDHLREQGKLPIPESESNPYVEAFWKWWPELYPSLKVFRITGGEPLLTRNTFRVLDYIDEHPRPDLELAVNSNLGVPRKLIEKFADSAERILNGGKVEKLILFTSVDTWGEQAAYIRTGMNFEEFWNNVHYLLERLPKLQIVFMCTFNALSVPRFDQLIREVQKLKQQYAGPTRPQGWAALLDVSYLRHPEHQAIRVLERDQLMRLETLHALMEELAEEKLGSGWGFLDFERAKLQRILEWTKEWSGRSSEDPSERLRNRADFYRYFSEHDRRRGTSFTKTFPELADFWERCRFLAESTPLHGPYVLSEPNSLSTPEAQPSVI